LIVLQQLAGGALAGVELRHQACAFPRGLLRLVEQRRVLQQFAHGALARCKSASMASMRLQRRAHFLVQLSS
jgi:hypothetical protein